jgi:hypothetical protein
VSRPTMNVALLFAVQIGAISLMLSCASSQPPERFTVRVAAGFTGTIHVNTCVPSAPATDLTVDEQGVGATSACPSRDATVELTVLRADQQYTVAAPDISILRTGDGIPTSIRAEIRP